MQINQQNSLHIYKVENKPRHSLQIYREYKTKETKTSRQPYNKNLIPNKQE